MKRLALLATIALGLCTIVKAAQVALTPETWAALVTVGERLLASSGFAFLLVGTACAFLLSCAAAAWERAERGDERDAASARARAELAARGYTVRSANLDPSSLADDSPKGPLPETWRAPCGEPIALRTCGTCGLIVIRDACGQPWPRPYVRSGFHLACGHGSACHPPAHARAASSITSTDSGRPAA